MRSRALLLLSAASLISLGLLAGSLYFGRDGLHRISRAALNAYRKHGDQGASPDSLYFSEMLDQADKAPTLSIDAYLDAILETKSTNIEIPNMKCPALDRTRYQSLKVSGRKDEAIRYYFAVNVRQSLPILPRLIASVIEAIRHLGPRHCAVSIVDGDSADGTDDVLAALRPYFRAQGINYNLTSLSFEPNAANRTARLAEFRNEALRPLYSDPARAHENATVIFLDDVAICTEDILELTLQRMNLGADMTCGMDWKQGGLNATFRDIWTARSMDGDSFYEASTDGSPKTAAKLFANAKETQARFMSGRPFQVFSCWNGVAAFAAKPLLDGLRFRAPKDTPDECKHPETHLFCKDLWFGGHGRIAVVPTVSLGNSIDKAREIKEAKGFVSDLVSKQDPNDDSIDWKTTPPAKVKCMPPGKRQSWQNWNQALSGR
ncbi:hypothetical protein HIM_03267 [Hirsutella minnesotensis 3608]|nr:hypothetical protein HIM_03267 [Hirsutella minnesotensis 3608]